MKRVASAVTHVHDLGGSSPRVRVSVVGVKPLPLNTNSVPGTPLFWRTRSASSQRPRPSRVGTSRARPRVAMMVVRVRATRLMPGSIRDEGTGGHPPMRPVSVTAAQPGAPDAARSEPPSGILDGDGGLHAAAVVTRDGAAGDGLAGLIEGERQLDGLDRAAPRCSGLARFAGARLALRCSLSLPMKKSCSSAPSLVTSNLTGVPAVTVILLGSMVRLSASSTVMTCVPSSGVAVGAWACHGSDRGAAVACRTWASAPGRRRRPRSPRAPVTTVRR